MPTYDYNTSSTVPITYLSSPCIPRYDMNSTIWLEYQGMIVELHQNYIKDRNIKVTRTGYWNTSSWSDTETRL